MILTKQAAGFARIVAESLVGSILARIHRILVLDSCRRLVGRLQRALAVPPVARPVARPERMIHREDRTPVDAMIRARIGRRRRHPPEVGEHILVTLKPLPLRRLVRPDNGRIILRTQPRPELVGSYLLNIV